MNELSEVEILATAIQIIHQESLMDDRLLDEAAKQRVLERSQARTQEMVAKNKVRSLRSGLKTMVRDLTHSVRTDTRSRIASRISVETGLNIDSFVKDEKTKILAILARGIVKTESEYRIIRAFMEDAEATPIDPAILANIAQILGEFEIRKLAQKK